MQLKIDFGVYKNLVRSQHRFAQTKSACTAKMIDSVIENVWEIYKDAFWGNLKFYWNYLSGTSARFLSTISKHTRKGINKITEVYVKDEAEPRDTFSQIITRFPVANFKRIGSILSLSTHTAIRADDDNIQQSELVGGYMSKWHSLEYLTSSYVHSWQNCGCLGPILLILFKWD